MPVIDILQKIKVETERLLVDLHNSATRVYEISAGGTIVERTAQLQDYYASVRDQLQRVIDLLRPAERA